MAKKRKSDATRLDEVDRTIYSTFCSAANSLSQLYTQAMSQQKLAFQAGERHGMEKIYQWILRQHEEGSRVAAADIVAYLQNELDYSGEDATMSPRLQHQLSQPTVHFMNPSTQVSSGSFGQATVGQGPQSWHSDQSKNSVFSNALSSPVRRSLQPFHLAQGGYYQNNVLATGNATARNHETNFPHQRDSNNCNSNDSSMDMHEESPLTNLTDNSGQLEKVLAGCVKSVGYRRESTSPLYCFPCNSSPKVRYKKLLFMEISK